MLADIQAGRTHRKTDLEIATRNAGPVSSENKKTMEA